MPISKTGRLYYTKEQYDAAKRNSSALEYVRSQGYTLERCGSYYRLKDHDSMVFTPEGKWFWNSRRLHGTALEFIVHYECRSFPEAVLILAGAMETAPRRNPSPPDPVPQGKLFAAPDVKTPVPFQLPPRAKGMRRLFGYLCGTRKLDYQLVKEMIVQGIVYESIYLTPSGKELHNACFVSYDSMGNPCSAYQRGMTSGGPSYKGEIPGGCKDWGWILQGRQPTTLYVFEAAIDAASYVTILRRQGKDPLFQGDFLALGGLNYAPIERYLERHPHTEQVVLLLDTDAPGRAAARQFLDRLQELGYQAAVQFPPTGKDWNEALCRKGTQQINSK